MSFISLVCKYRRYFPHFYFFSILILNFNLKTCAHWACKHGNVEILKLIASTLENDTKSNPKSIRINNLINSKTVIVL